jgi:hypothetical protein
MEEFMHENGTIRPIESVLRKGWRGNNEEN